MQDHIQLNLCEKSMLKTVENIVVGSYLLTLLLLCKRERIFLAREQQREREVVMDGGDYH